LQTVDNDTSFAGRRMRLLWIYRR